MVFSRSALGGSGNRVEIWVPYEVFTKNNLQGLLNSHRKQLQDNRGKSKNDAPTEVADEVPTHAPFPLNIVRLPAAIPSTGRDPLFGRTPGNRGLVFGGSTVGPFGRRGGWGRRAGRSNSRGKRFVSGPWGGGTGPAGWGSRGLRGRPGKPSCRRGTCGGRV